MHLFTLPVAVIVSAPFGENTYIAHLPDRQECFVIDPGLEPQRIIDHLLANNLSPAAILITHGHSDHIAGNTALKQRWPACPLIIGRGDAPKLTDPWKNLSAQFGQPLVSPAADRLLDDGEKFVVAGVELETRVIAGHSSGHVVFVWHDGEPPMVFGGDVLFAGSVGRTDFPGGDFEALSHGIRTQLFTLPDETIVLPGHGPQTTVGAEKKTNPFVGAPSGD